MFITKEEDLWTLGPSIPGEGTSWVLKGFPILVELVKPKGPVRKTYYLACAGLGLEKVVFEAEADTLAKGEALRFLRKRLKEMVQLIEPSTIKEYGHTPCSGKNSETPDNLKNPENKYQVPEKKERLRSQHQQYAECRIPDSEEAELPKL